MRKLVGLLAAVILIGACSDGPVDRSVGPSVATVDSAAWRARMAGRPAGLMLSPGMTDCGTGSGECTFVPTNYHCGGTKVECTFQGTAITVTPQTVTPRTVVVSGSGALLCNSTMGTVYAYNTANAVVTAVDLVPIDPSDCGSDNITFGGTATLSWAPGIAYIVIQPPSPWTFPVQGGGTGIASAFYNVQLNDEAIPFVVSCPATPTRGDAVTCTAVKADPTSDATITGWQWVADVGGQVIPRTLSVTFPQWSGTVVASGRVEVTAEVNGQPFPLPAVSNRMAVQPRNWSGLNAQSTVNLISPNTLPAQPIDAPGQLGTTLGVPGLTHTLTQITDGGPNESFWYYTGLPISVRHDIAINASMDPGQPFYLRQDLVMGKQYSAKKGLKYRWCWQARMPLFKDIIEAHEGTQSETNSHVGVYTRELESLMRAETEPFSSTTGESPNLLQSIADRANAASVQFETAPNNGFVIDPAQQVIFPQDNIRCRPRYF